MKIRLPKDLTGVKYPRLLTIDMNDFDIDLFLPSLFFTILSQGKGKARQSNDPTHIQRYIDTLAHNPTLEGFADKAGRKVLERLVRTTLIKTSGVGRANKGEQISTIVPYTLLAHKPGFPLKTSRNRAADSFLYHILRSKLHKADDELLAAMKLIFGHGVIINKMPDLGGGYDGKTELDTLTRLSVAFLDGFQNTRPGLTREQSNAPACPALADMIAEDVLRFLFTYYQRMPTQAFTYHFLALINFELFTYTLKLVYGINQLVTDPTILPVAMEETLKLSPPQLYLDFTNEVRERSHEMAKACVRRDVEAYQQFLPAILHLRLLDTYAEQLRRDTKRKAKINALLGEQTEVPLYLQRLLLLQDDPSINTSIQARAQTDEERIREENRYIEDTKKEKDEDPLEDAEALAWLDEVTASAETDIERVVLLLAEAQKSDGLTHFIRWYWGTGGLKKPHGVLRGTPKSRPSWRYAPSNDLLAVLVQVAAARLSPPNELRPIRLSEFLDFLEQRFGILIDRPPDTFQGAEYAAAARDNLRAMLDRLRQMGIFRDLSDDFTVQRLHPPYMGMTQRRVEA